MYHDLKMCDQCSEWKKKGQIEPKPDFFKLDPGANHAVMDFSHVHDEHIKQSNGDEHLFRRQDGGSSYVTFNQIYCHKCSFEDTWKVWGELDKIDEKMLDIVLPMIQKNLDISDSEIAKQVGLSESDFSLDDWLEKMANKSGDIAQSQKLGVGFTKWGLQVWCIKHEINIWHGDFRGIQFPMFPGDLEDDYHEFLQVRSAGIHKNSKKGYYPGDSAFVSPGFMESDPDLNQYEDEENGRPIWCNDCGEDLRSGDFSLTEKSETTLRDYALVTLSYTLWGIQIWCQRHNINVIHIDFQGEKLVSFPVEPPDKQRGKKDITSGRCICCT